MNTIELKQITKTYDSNKGIKNLNLIIKKGEVIGFLGPNGAGKTTTMRLLMGFTKPTNGIALINQLDCFKDSHKIQNHIGYLPSEISFSHDNIAIDYLKYIAKLKKINSLTTMYKLIEYFKFDSSLQIKKMSKGTKQKLAIILCFMHNPDIYLLDEPTSGLDPIMQHKFIQYILEEKSKGKTIIISSHLFEEIDKTCDRVILLKDGTIHSDTSVKELKNKQGHSFEITFENIEELTIFSNNKETQKNNLTVTYNTNSLNTLINELSQYSINQLCCKQHQIEDFFIDIYKGELND